jgi:hypothetical protein
MRELNHFLFKQNGLKKHPKHLHFVYFTYTEINVSDVINFSFCAICEGYILKIGRYKKADFKLG